MSGWAAFQSPQVLVRTVIISNSTPWSGPESPRPLNVSNRENDPYSNITLLERESRPEVRSSSGPPSTVSVKYAWADPHRVQ